MQNQMPQEIEVWYTIPAIRRELTKSMVEDCKLTQKQIADYMGITEAAVSQYISSKRAKDVVFSNTVLEEIKKSAEKIVGDGKQLIPEMMRITKLTGVKQVMCDIHMKQDVNLPDGCEICFDEDVIKIKTR